MEKYNNEMEQAILGCMLLDQSIVPNVMNELSETDLFYPVNQRIYNKIIKLSKSDKQIDIGVISHELKQDTVYIAELTDKVSTSANWEYYTKQIKALSKVRETEEIKCILDNVTSENVDGKVSSIIKKCVDIANKTGVNEIRTCREMMNPVLSLIENAIVNRGKISGYDSGFEAYNELLDGIQSEYIILAARTNIGKSAFAVNIAKNLVQQNIPVGYFSLEMSGEQLMMRILSDVTTVQARALKNGMLTEVDTQKIMTIGGNIAEYPLYIVENIRNFDKIIAKCRYLVRVKGVKCLFIDHASIIKYRNEKLMRNEQFSQISAEIQALQRELNVPIILVAQLGRGTEGKAPSLNDLRESGAFEQDADTVILMHRERMPKDGERWIRTEFNVAKNRNGQCGLFNLDFYMDYVRFTNIKKY